MLNDLKNEKSKKMIKNTPLEYINDRIKQHKENINKYTKEIERLQNFIKTNEIRMTELEIIKDILQKGEKI
ncbi:hypothetical protein [Spiroplasma endosymbiont of Tricholauxania praeusta]|uniref:hypothetical protein n=1 Tax=Spiroplasma endosymbiont of Tricholauxania praeusta TaxID=3066296 RepID=UPI0030D36A18